MPVKSYATKHPFGLYDMSGNIAESCSDRYQDIYTGGTNPTGTEGEHYVRRGGHFNGSAATCQVSHRSRHIIGAPHVYAGFRLACSPK